MLRGLPASGKSKKAEEIIKGGGEYFRVNRDLLREMLHCNVWTGKREGTTINAQQLIVADLLSKGKNVIVDDTNLGEKHMTMWKTIADMYDAKFEVINMMNEVTVAECLERDSQRLNPVGAHVIYNMAIQYNYLELDKLVVVDIDGTVADGEHRQHHLKGDKKDWKSYFDLMSGDAPRMDVYEQAVKEAKKSGAKILFVSARPDNYRVQTIEWLNKHDMTDSVGLLMRNAGDKRPDTEVKSDIYKRYLQQYEVVKVFDDRPSVIRMWQEKGLDVVDVGKGEEF